MIEENQLISIAVDIKHLRKTKNLSLKELSELCGLSSAMISKIENRRSIPSISTLLLIASALEVELADLVKNVKRKKPNTHVLLKKNTLKKVHKEKSEKFDYRMIHSLDITNLNHLEFNHITIDPGAKREKVETDGYQYIYCLKGTLDLILGDEVIKMSSGDTLYFDGSIPHLPKCTSKAAVEILVLYLLH
jgi:transcriptional regulator with XRE-family HTH domain